MNEQHISVVIIDDENSARNTLRALIDRHCPQLRVVAEAENLKQGLEVLQEARPDLVFLDIEMPDGSGFDLLQLLPHVNFKLVFVTAYDKYAVRAFRASAMDYLLKPVEVELLKKITEKMLAEKVQPNLPQQLQLLLSNQQQVTKIALPCSDGLIFQNISEIVHLEAEDNYTHFNIVGGKRILVSRTLKEFEMSLPENLFCRVHKSHLVNLQYVDRFVSRDGAHLLLSNGDRIPVSKRKKDQILERFK